MALRRGLRPANLLRLLRLQRYGRGPRPDLWLSFPGKLPLPFLSGSVTEFWRRWHISLGSWFRDYAYIPLGGSRCSRSRWLLNVFLVWGLTGLWHGAAWNFVLWGLFFAVLLAAEKLWYGHRLEKTRLLKHLYMLPCWR